MFRKRAMPVTFAMPSKDGSAQPRTLVRQELPDDLICLRQREQRACIQCMRRALPTFT